MFKNLLKKVGRYCTDLLKTPDEKLVDAAIDAEIADSEKMAAYATKEAVLAGRNAQLDRLNGKDDRTLQWYYDFARICLDLVTGCEKTAKELKEIRYEK